MKTKNFIVTSALAFLLFLGVGIPARAALTDSQIQAILDLLTSFGADSTIVTNVGVVLQGGTPGGTSGSPAAPPIATSSSLSLLHNLYYGLTDTTTDGEVTKL